MRRWPKSTRSSRRQRQARIEKIPFPKNSVPPYLQTLRLHFRAKGSYLPSSNLRAQKRQRDKNLDAELGRLIKSSASVGHEQDQG